ncbi:unnamed protein product [Rhizophagus irregularis]|uniref:Uncharacterized protein n=1 Tax=Rhizophagus irregularis TaxID=588596 RepID=A0A916E8B2_9GLOM|nr:unnamed protein product [Rhizophagus irregularis]CAB5370267.1 unnamed protein product [Rhizophagus irregularis]
MPPKKTKKTAKSNLQKTSQKRKYVKDESEESLPAPKLSPAASNLRHLSHIFSQSSNFTEAFHNLEALKLVKSKTNHFDLPSSASKFYPDNLKLLKITFVGALAEKDVIPEVPVTQIQAIFQKLDKYLLPTIDSETLGNHKFDVTTHTDITSEKVQTFVTKLHDVVINGAQQIGMDETFTDTLIDDLLRIVKLNNFPLMIRNHLISKIYIKGSGIVISDPKFVIQKKGKLSLLVVEDKHLKNITSATDYGESQIAAEMLACGSENLRYLGKDTHTDQIILAMRVISTYVTFYKTVIKAEYWKELDSGLPKKEEVEIQRWPAKNGLRAGFDFAEPTDRQTVFEILAKIRESLLVESNDEVQTEAVTAGVSGSNK